MLYYRYYIVVIISIISSTRSTVIANDNDSIFKRSPIMFLSREYLRLKIKTVQNINAHVHTWDVQYR